MRRQWIFAIRRAEPEGWRQAFVDHHEQRHPGEQAGKDRIQAHNPSKHDVKHPAGDPQGVGHERRGEVDLLVAELDADGIRCLAGADLIG